MRFQRLSFEYTSHTHTHTTISVAIILYTRVFGCGFFFDVVLHLTACNLIVVSQAHRVAPSHNRSVPNICPSPLRERF